MMNYFAHFSVCAAVAHAATTYYVSMDGSDQATGITVADAWRTLARASNQTFQHGDSLLLSRDGIWQDDPLRVDLSSASGFLLGAYGNSTRPRPLIELSRPSKAVDASSCVIVSDPTSGTTIENLHIAGCAFGLVLLHATSDNSTDVTIQNNFFRDIRNAFEAYTPAAGRWGEAITLRSVVPESPALDGGVQSFGATSSNLTVRNNVALRTSVFFAGGGSQVFIRGLSLQSNTVENCGGNCYFIGRSTSVVLQDSVFLRDRPDRFFIYGTTDIIFGSVEGYNVVKNNDFNRRGETEGGPDGCAVDFETSATGVEVSGNTFSHSWGAGIMIFGHATTSHGLNITGNVFDQAGCDQIRNDHAGIAIMCPNFQKPSGTIADNTFQTCPSGLVPAIWANPEVPGCNSSIDFSGNQIDTVGIVQPPRISIDPTQKGKQLLPFLAVSDTPNATIRYTLDGSRPSESSPVLPPGDSILLPWPAPATAVNVRAFKDGFAPSVTNGKVIELDRAYPLPTQYMRGNLDGLFPPKAPSTGLGNSGPSGNSGPQCVQGWIVDPSLVGAGVPPVNITITVDRAETPMANVIANVYREDLVKAKVAPNPEHGFFVCFTPEQWAPLQEGMHRLLVQGVGTAQTTPLPWNLPGSPLCILNGSATVC